MSSPAKLESPQSSRWPGMAGFRVLIADDHPVVRVGVRNMLASEPSIKVVGEAGDGEEALDLAQRITPDILLLDLSMPRLSGLDVLERLGAGSPSVKIILLTASITERETIQALQAGARGLILKNSLTDQITDAVKAVATGAFWINGQSISDIAPVLRSLEHQIERESLKPERKNYRLTPREMEVIHSIVEGCSNRDIATQFKISEETVKRHLSNIFDKTGVSTRLELAMFAIAHELVKPDF